ESSDSDRLRFPPVRFSAVDVSMPGMSSGSDAATPAEEETATDAARGGIQRSSAVKSFSGSMGFPMWSFMPAARHASRSRSMAFAVMAIIGNDLYFGFERTDFVAV